MQVINATERNYMHDIMQFNHFKNFYVLYRQPRGSHSFEPIQVIDINDRNYDIMHLPHSYA